MTTKAIVADMTRPGEGGPIIAEGETDGRRTEREYVRVGGQLYHYAWVFRDTPENREILERAWRKHRELTNEASTLIMRTSNQLSNERF
jgi:hypothetical protein